MSRLSASQPPESFAAPDIDLINRSRVYPTTRRFLREYLPGHTREYVVGLLFLLLTIGVTVAMPGLVGDGITILESASGKLTSEATSKLKTLALSIIGLGLALVAFRTLSRVIIFLPGRRIEALIRQDFFEAAISLPHEQLDSMATGDLVSRATNDITSVRVLLSMGVLHVVNSVLMIVFCLTMMIRISGMLTLICLLMVPVVVFAVRILSSRMMRQVRTVQSQLGLLTGTVREQLGAHALLNVYPVFSGVISRFDKENDAYRDAATALQRTRVVLFNLSYTLSSLATFVLLYVGGPMVIREQFTIAAFVEFSIYLGLIQDPLRAWGFLISIFQRGEVCLTRLYDLRDVAGRYAEKQTARPVASTTQLDERVNSESPIIAVRGLLYEYPARSADGDAKSARPFRLEIDHLDLHAGKRYGLFGSTGCGKSTLAELITGNRQTPKNSISFHGVSYDDVSAAALMRQIAYVPQESRHFNHSIRENLRQIQSLRETTEGFSFELEDALRISCLKRDVDGFSQGLGTVIGEHGIRLSGGQKQRLALVRALLKPHKMLLLDDVVSAVDHETESLILKHLFENLHPNDTLLIISHRISALCPCDEIFIMEEGRIVAHGSHDALLEKHAGYRNTWQHQIIEQKLEDLGHA